VKRVIDGDTLVALQTHDNKEVRIRLKCVDAPETKQEPWGKKATEKLKFDFFELKLLNNAKIN
jgi:endonuclease YncB( thermonuclease family)